jgi:predicted nucleic acid-binding protein
MRLVLDASVAIKWYVPEVHAIRALHILDRDVAFSAPDLIYAEVGNTLWKMARRGDLSRERAADIFSKFREVTIEIYSSIRLLDVAFNFATGLDCSFYDSLYLALAVANDCPVITADEKFYTLVKSSPLAGHVRWIGEGG